MPLSKNQQNYIKENYKHISPGEIAADLDISEKEVMIFLEKKLSYEKFKKIKLRFTPKLPIDSFRVIQFFRENYLFFILLAFLVFVTYANSLNNALVSDDVEVIGSNLDVGKFSSIFSSFGGVLQKFIYFAIHNAFGTDPTYYRIFNILLHLGVTWLIYLILSLLHNKKIGFIAASLFAIHPILSESVVWISGQPYVQNAFFFLLSFFFYLLGSKRKSYYYASIFFFILSMSASERGFIMFLIFPLYEWFFGNLRENWKKTMPFFAVGLAVAAMALSMVGNRESILQSNYYIEPGTDDLFYKIPTSVASYFGLIFWPDKLTIYHTEMTYTPGEYWLTVLVFLSYAGVIVYYFFKNKPVCFWLTFFLIPLSPTLSPLRIAWGVAERYAYLSTLGIIFFIAWIFYKIAEREKIRMATYIVIGLIIALLSARTIIRNTDWKNDENLWFATARTSPSGYNTHNNLGLVYQRKGDNEKAIEEYKKAIDINPRYADSYHNLGNVYYQIQQYDEAEASFRKAVELNPNLWQSYQNLAVIYFAKGKFEEAKKELLEAKALSPNDPVIQQDLDTIENTLRNNSNIQPVGNNQ